MRYLFWLFKKFKATKLSKEKVKPGYLILFLKKFYELKLQREAASFVKPGVLTNGPYPGFRKTKHNIIEKGFFLL